MNLLPLDIAILTRFLAWIGGLITIGVLILTPASKPSNPTEDPTTADVRLRIRGLSFHARDQILAPHRIPVELVIHTEVVPRPLESGNRRPKLTVHASLVHAEHARKVWSKRYEWEMSSLTEAEMQIKQVLGEVLSIADPVTGTGVFQDALWTEI